MQFLGITDRRSWKIKAPLESLDNNSKVISPSSQTPAGYLKLIKEGQNILNSIDIDVLLSNGDGVAAFVSSILGKKQNIPTIIQIGGNCWQDHFSRLVGGIADFKIQKFLKHLSLLGMNRVSFKQATGVFAVSESIRRKILLNTSLSTNNVRVVRTPIKQTISSPWYNNSVDNMLTVTNLNYKGKFAAIRDALYCISKVLRENESKVYTIAGEGKYRQKLEEFAIKEFPQVSERIIFKGFVEEISSVYKTADVFIYPSYEDGYPTTVLEAQEAGLPIITNSGQGMDDQVEEKETGLFVNWNKPNEAAVKLSELVTSAERVRYLGRKSRSQVIQRNSINRIGSDMEENASYIIGS